MNNTIRSLTAISVIFLSGCIGEQASIGERMRDNFAFTAAQNIPNSEVRCITLIKPFTMPSGSVTYSLPAGKYIARKKNSTGYFYYAPSPITSSNWFFSESQEGIYLDNQSNKGNVFSKPQPNSYVVGDDRPIRRSLLPNTIFSYIKKNNNC